MQVKVSMISLTLVSIIAAGVARHTTVGSIPGYSADSSSLGWIWLAQGAPDSNHPNIGGTPGGAPAASAPLPGVFPEGQYSVVPPPPIPPLPQASPPPAAAEPPSHLCRHVYTVRRNPLTGKDEAVIVERCE